MHEDCRAIAIAIHVLGRRLALPLFTLLLLVMLCIDLAIGVTQSYYEFYNVLLPTKRYSVVVGGFALAPFTSIVDIEKIRSLVKNAGVDAKVRPMYITIGFANGRAVIVLGTNSSWRCFYCCAIGATLAKELNVSIGSYIALSSPFITSSLLLRVIDIVNDEHLQGLVVVPNEIAQLLRGLTPRQASLVLIECNNRTCIERIASALGSSIPSKLIERMVLILKKLQIGAKVSQELSEVYMQRLGISRNTLFVLDLALSFVIALGIYIFTANIYALIRGEVEVLTLLGVSRKCILVSMSVLLVIATVLAFIASHMLLHIFRPTITVFSYPIRIEIDVQLHIIATAMVVALSLIGAARGARH